MKMKEILNGSRVKAASMDRGRIELAATRTAAEVLEMLGSTPQGLSAEGVECSRREHGSNRPESGKKKTLPARLVQAFIEPFTVVLFFLAAVSVVTDMVFPALSLFGRTPGDFDCATAVIIVVLLLISGTLRFVQETRSENAAQKLLEMIGSTCTVSRGGPEKEEIPMEQVVTGDIVHLSVGDMVPADVRILDARDLFISQASLTGESVPVEKTPGPDRLRKSVMDYTDIAFMGSNVISGTASAVVIGVGEQTMFGALASQGAGNSSQTGFSRGVDSVSRVLIRFMAVMTPLVFLLNGLTKGDWLSALLFAISIAVGLTPEMLPMIVTTCLAKGAVSMSKKQVIVKNLDAIQSFGAMDILCTDKTGTLTEDQVILQRHLNVNGEEDTRVLRYAYLNSYFQTGYKNLMDLAIIRRTEAEEAADPQLLDLSENYTKVDEIPFDFSRRRLTTVVRGRSGKTQMITKGAVEEMLSICAWAECGEAVQPLSGQLKKQVLDMARRLSEEGFRVLALARKDSPSPVDTFGVQDECNMVLLGYLAFLDPPKASAAKTVASLGGHGVSMKVLTGDNENVTRNICGQVGLRSQKILSGPMLDQMDEEQLCEAAGTADIFAKLTPLQKERVVKALRKNGHTVGFLGDGINDAAAMRAADIGISVDTAADVAKEAADVILLEKDLTVLEQGILEGRRTYVNMIRYIKMAASSNFGNMLSVLVASALLPFLPMTGLQLLLLNLLCDLTCLALPWDRVDDGALKNPRPWDASSIGGYMLRIGPASSALDIAAYLLLYFVICPAAVGGQQYAQLTDPAARELYMALFHAGWFVESMWSQVLAIHMLRTPRLLFFQSRAALPVTLSSLAGISAATILPFTAIGSLLGFAALPPAYFGWLCLILLGYMLLAAAAKRGYIRKYGELL